MNNAGIGAIGTVEDNDDAEWRRVLDVNVVGMARVTASALPHLRRSSSASVVNVCSIAALNGLPQRALYSASKGAVLSLTFAMAADHVADGVRVNCVCPGTVDTAWVGRLLQAADDPAADAPLSRPARPSVGWLRRTRSRGPSSIWRARGQGRPPGRRSMSMGVLAGYGFGPGGDGRAQGGVGYRPGSGRRREYSASPTVTRAQQIARSNIRNYSIYRYGDLLFSYFEYVGEDLDADLPWLPIR